MQSGGLKLFADKAIRQIRTYGIIGMLKKNRYKLFRKSLSNLYGQNKIYQTWLKKHTLLTENEVEKMKNAIGNFAVTPKISVLMPTYNSNIVWLKEAIESVRNQIYTNWELCIADDASTIGTCKTLLLDYQKSDSRIKVVFRNENGHISRASNSALEMATGEWSALLDHDDKLPADTLYWVADAINKKPDAAIIYSDEDKIDAKGKQTNPYFKCDWNYDLFLSQNFICHLGIFKIEIVKEIGGFRAGFEGSQDYDLVLRIIEKVSKHRIIHIPRVLYHWRSHLKSTSMGSDKKPYSLLAGQRAIDEHLSRTGVQAIVEIRDNIYYRVKYHLPTQKPAVSLIIPTRNNKKLLQRCIESITTKTTYPNYEIIIIDNNSDDEATKIYFKSLVGSANIRVLEDKREFNFSAINNLAVKNTGSEYLCFLNNDTAIISPDWLSEMMSFAVQPGVGAVGARLWYPNNTLQHGGVILEIGGVAGHSHKYLSKGNSGYFNRAVLIQDFSAITAACMLISKKIFDQIGGFDEINLPVAFNDVDLCLKIRDLGYRIVWTPFAELYHHESASRGDDRIPQKQIRFAKEVEYMKKTWGAKLTNDPAYSPNLTVVSEDFSFAWPPRISPSFIEI